MQEEPAAEMAASVPVDGVGMEKESNSGERAAPAGCSDGDFAWANGERSYVWAVTSSRL